MKKVFGWQIHKSPKAAAKKNDDMHEFYMVECKMLTAVHCKNAIFRLCVKVIHHMHQTEVNFHMGHQSREKWIPCNMAV